MCCKRFIFLLTKFIQFLPFKVIQYPKTLGFFRAFSILNSKFPIITSLGTYQNGVIDLHDAKIIYGVHPLHAFIPDTSSGGYKADIDLSDYGFTGEMWASVTPRYPNGHPYVSIASVSASKVTLLSDVNVSGAYAQWSVIGKTN